MAAMRVNALILFAALGLVIGFADLADAEKVKTNQTTKLYSRAGEQSKVIVTVKSGQNMTLLAQDGRWLKVRVQGRTGYVPRSKVDMADDEDIARNTRRRPFVDGRSKRRGFGSEQGPDDRIGADAVGDGDDEEDDEPRKVAKKPASRDDDDEDEDDEPAPKKPVKAVAKSSSKSRDDDEDEDDEEDSPPKRTATKSSDDDEDSDDSGDDEDGDSRPTVRVAKKVAILDKPKASSEVSFTARPSDRLYAIEEKGDWTFVENEDADGGWIRTSDLDGGGGGGSGKRVINVGARVGLMFIQQGMRSAGSTNLNVPDNYNIGTSSVTVALGAGILVPYKNKFLLGGELTWEYSKTVFGGVFYDPDGAANPMPGVNIGVSVSNVNARFTPGIDLKTKSGMALFGHLGYRYQGFLISDVTNMAANPAKLPSEVLKGPTIGAALAIPRLTDKLGLKASLDAMVVGASVTQTKGLEDGASPSAKAVTLEAGITYKWKPKMDLQATYDLNYAGVDFGAPLATSQRGHMGTSVSRTDIFHMVTFGLAMPF
jgi:SH3-like domain-containing protein